MVSLKRDKVCKCYGCCILYSQEYWLATVPSTACYLGNTTSCVFYLAFCHPIPAVLGGTVCYDSAVCQDYVLSNGTKSKLSMGTYGRYTAFIQSELVVTLPHLCMYMLLF